MRDEETEVKISWNNLHKVPQGVSGIIIIWVNKYFYHIILVPMLALETYLIF